MEDDLEYHISFPIPKHCTEANCSGPESKGSDASVSRLYTHGNSMEDFYTKASKSLKVEPVIFLLGWFGAEDKYLAKYSTLYNNLGCIAIRYTAPPQNSFFNSQKKLTLISEKLLCLLEETTLSTHPVIFHNFSNHGANLYSYISKNLQKSSGRSLKIKGCIFDSCPAPQTILSVSRATYRSLKGFRCIKLLASVGVAIFASVTQIGRLVSWVFTGRMPISPPWDLIQEPFRWPQLFIYSKTDDLIWYKDIESFALERSSSGVEVFKKRFEDSPHVAHLKTNFEQYESTVNQFLAHCLGKQVD